MSSPSSIACSGRASRPPGSYVPQSQTMTSPAPYWPFGMTPSKSKYSIGWSSTWTAIRRIVGSRVGPLGTAQLDEDAVDLEAEVVVEAGRAVALDDEPAALDRRRGLPGSPAGSGVFAKSRLRWYCSSGIVASLASRGRFRADRSSGRARGPTVRRRLRPRSGGRPNAGGCRAEAAVRRGARTPAGLRAEPPHAGARTSAGPRARLDVRRSCGGAPDAPPRPLLGVLAALPRSARRGFFAAGFSPPSRAIARLGLLRIGDRDRRVVASGLRRR